MSRLLRITAASSLLFELILFHFRVTLRTLPPRFRCHRSKLVLRSFARLSAAGELLLRNSQTGLFLSSINKTARNAAHSCTCPIGRLRQTIHPLYNCGDLCVFSAVSYLIGAPAICGDSWFHRIAPFRNRADR